jgi:DNA-binding transcriptional LysR family regulator
MMTVGSHRKMMMTPQTGDTLLVRVTHDAISVVRPDGDALDPSKHVAASRRGVAVGPVDHALAEIGLSRDVVVVVSSFAAAPALATSSDLVAPPPRWFVATRIGRTDATDGFAIFDLRVAVDGMVVSQM